METCWHVANHVLHAASRETTSLKTLAAATLTVHHATYGLSHLCACISLASSAAAFSHDGAVRLSTRFAHIERSMVRCCILRTQAGIVSSSEVTISIPSASSLVARPHLGAIALMQAVPHINPDSLVSSRFRFFTQDAHARSTPSLRSILPSVYEDGFSSHQYPLRLP